MRTYCFRFVLLLIGILVFLCLINSHACLCRQANAGWVTETVDDNGGGGPSLAFDPVYKIPCIAYYDNINHDLKYAYYLPGPQQWIRTTVSSGDGDRWIDSPSLAFDPISGYPAIACRYYEGFTYLEYAYFNGTDWVITTADASEKDVGWWPSLAFDPVHKIPCIAEYDDANGNLKYAYYLPGSQQWIRTNVDTAGKVGGHPSLAFDPASGTPAIAYLHYSYKNLRYAFYSSVFRRWIKQDVDFVGSTVGFVYGTPSLAFDPASGTPAIAYYDLTNGNLKYAYQNNRRRFVKEIVDSAGDVGNDSSLAFDPTSGTPAIAYYDATNGDLKYVRRVFVSLPHKPKTEGRVHGFWRWVKTTVDSAGDVGRGLSLAFDPTSGNPSIAYYDYTNEDLKYAHWVPDTTTTTTTTTPTPTTTIPCQCPPDSIPSTGCISGRVTDLAGSPLANRTVKLKRGTIVTLVSTKITDVNGCYWFTNLTDGTYKVILKCCDTCTAILQTKTITGGGHVNGVNFECP